METMCAQITHSQTNPPEANNHKLFIVNQLSPCGRTAYLLPEVLTRHSPQRLRTSQRKMERRGASALRDTESRPLIVASPAMRELLEFAHRAASGDAKVLITGETGVGKDVLASHIHQNSRRRQAEYVAVNCAGLTESLLESELFGHVKGSFTGAFRDKVGKVLLANGGTLFLDEVGEMSLRMQALLFGFLQNGALQA